MEVFMFSGERLKKARKRKEYSQKRLANMIDVSTSLIAHYERNGIQHPRADIIEQLADILGTSIDYLMERSDFIEVPDSFDDLIKVPVYGSVPAGTPIEALEVDYGYIGVERERFKGDKKLIGLKVKGDSMYPYYMEGDIVIVELTCDFNSGDDVIVFVGYDYEATLKTIHKEEDYIELEPLNREYPIKRYGKDDLPVRVLGVVRELIRDVKPRRPIRR